MPKATSAQKRKLCNAHCFSTGTMGASTSRCTYIACHDKC